MADDDKDSSVDLSAWMGQYLNDETPLNRITFPFSHNSATAALGAVRGRLARCQRLGVSQQLNIGVRGLDIRVSEVNKSRHEITTNEALLEFAVNHIWASHRFKSCRLTLVLLDIRDFIDTHPTEIVVIRVERDWDGTLSKVGLRALLILLRDTFGDDRLASAADFQRSTIGELRKSGRRILLCTKSGFLDELDASLGKIPTTVTPSGPDPPGNVGLDEGVRSTNAGNPVEQVPTTEGISGTELNVATVRPSTVLSKTDRPFAANVEEGRAVGEVLGDMNESTTVDDRKIKAPSSSSSAIERSLRQTDSPIREGSQMMTSDPEMLKWFRSTFIPAATSWGWTRGQSSQMVRTKVLNYLKDHERYKNPDSIDIVEVIVTPTIRSVLRRPWKTVESNNRHLGSEFMPEILSFIAQEGTCVSAVSADYVTEDFCQGIVRINRQRR